ncbi:hypothetical protein [Williamsoniiplasma luminosum]|uniref:Uncharacterized protein n=1 Tax=Williamsoniiplasma luminosum TaxID=214888 RepID=A0A2S0NK77_9MOLU|nr:hypothetical protein [Williamsoniiplasma luminosum]AVP49409.1 MAG: hypothetical protein C5T88_02375 [Williamsoniiplasma luminosum]
MKKLLLLLNSICVVASTAATVFACNNVKRIDIEVVPNGTNFIDVEPEMIKGYSNIQAVEVDFLGAELSSQHKIFSSVEYTTSNIKGSKFSKITFTAKNEIGFGYLRLKGSQESTTSPTSQKELVFLKKIFNVNVGKLDIKNTKVIANFNQNQETIENAIKNAIKTKTHGIDIIQDKDYVITGLDRTLSSSKIKVAAKKLSKVIKGEFAFELMKINLTTATDKVLGELPSDNDDQIIEAFLNQNPEFKGLPKTQLQIKSALTKTSGTVTIQIKGTHDRYHGEVVVTYTVAPPKTPNLDTLNAKIDQARLIAQNGKSGSDWTALQNAISTADAGKTEDKAADKTAALESAQSSYNSKLRYFKCKNRSSQTYCSKW